MGDGVEARVPGYKMHVIIVFLLLFISILSKFCLHNFTNNLTWWYCVVFTLLSCLWTRCSATEVRFNREAFLLPASLQTRNLKVLWVASSAADTQSLNEFHASRDSRPIRLLPLNISFVADRTSPCHWLSDSVTWLFPNTGLCVEMCRRFQTRWIVSTV